ncbi:MAG: hypothetical protein NVSMB44_40870 [Ktedonobacteraceae bacterium]
MRSDEVAALPEVQKASILRFFYVLYSCCTTTEKPIFAIVEKFVIFRIHPDIYTCICLYVHSGSLQ